MHSIYAASIVIDLIEGSDHRHGTSSPRRPAVKAHRVRAATGRLLIRTGTHLTGTVPG